MKQTNDIFSPWRFLRKIFLAAFVFLLLLAFLIWRTDNPRIEQFRFTLMDNYLPDITFLYKPFSGISNFVKNYQGYEGLSRENRELRRQLQQMVRWRESALQLEQINAELRALNNLSVTPQVSFISGEVIADSGSPFSQSALINIGRNKNVYVGAPVVDGFGLVGRVVGVGEDKSRILMLSDPTSQISAHVMPNRTRAIIRGSSGVKLNIIPIESGAKILAGSRVVTSGEGVYPPDLLIGYITVDIENQPSVRIAADYSALELARVLMPTAVPNVPTHEHVIIPEHTLTPATPTNDSEIDPETLPETSQEVPQ